MNVAYADFIARRRARVHAQGVEVQPGDLHHSLKPFQVDVIRWAARVGRPAIWADTGLGKTRMQLEWCRVMSDVSLIVAPLGVARQTPEEAALIHTEARYVRSGAEITGPGVYVTNYEMVDQFDPAAIGAVALDEASILKQSDGKTRSKLIQHFASVPFRSTWTATPAPNDPEELVIRAYQAAGFVYFGENVVDKDPQAQAIRTKAHSLMFVTKNKDSSLSRMAMADYGLIFKKPGERDRPVKTDVTNEEWIEFARPIWYGISEGDTLNARIARESDDERHLTPLQLGFTSRYVRLYTNPGETVFTAFGGVGSELYVAVKLGRRALGIELKPSYWKTGCQYLRELETELAQPAFDFGSAS